jgi:hypothetical protein
MRPPNKEAASMPSTPISSSTNFLSHPSHTQNMKINPPVNRLVGEMPKVGIRPAIDGRLHGVRESLEKTTMTMARNVAKLIASTLRHPNGLPVECVIANRCIGGVVEAAQAAEKFRPERRWASSANPSPTAPD